MNILLKDQTTGKNILWADEEHGAKEINDAQIKSIYPRYRKIYEHQKNRSRDRAEIFTPSDICKIQNDLIDIKNKFWTDYVDAKFIEITCGEAPYLASRYNVITGEAIPIAERVGLLDRKLHVVNKETSIFADWKEWTLRAVQSVYGYEFQGDSLFLARQNVLLTVVEYFQEKFSRKPPEDFLYEIAEVISWNLWQMNGLSCSPPFTDNANLFGGANCLIKDWRTNEILEFRSLLQGN